MSRNSYPCSLSRSELKLPIFDTQIYINQKNPAFFSVSLILFKFRLSYLPQRLIRINRARRCAKLRCWWSAGTRNSLHRSLTQGRRSTRRASTTTAPHTNSHKANRIIQTSWGKSQADVNQWTNSYWAVAWPLLWLPSHRVISSSPPVSKKRSRRDIGSKSSKSTWIHFPALVAKKSGLRAF